MKTVHFVPAMLLLALALAFSGCKKNSNPGAKPTVTTGKASQITKNSAVISGEVISDGSHAVTEKGFFFSNDGSPTNKSPKIIGGQDTGSFSCNLYSLKVNTTYYYMSYATNSLGTAYGDVKTFITKDRDAVLTVTGDNLLKTTSVVINIHIYHYGSVITETGVCYSTSHNPTTSDSKVKGTSQSGPMAIALTNLEANTHYYVRAYVITSTGTLYSPEYAIWSYAVMDYDGNGYHSVTIGNQTWLAENYRCTHYANGDVIPNVKENKYWSANSGSGLTSGARCYYNNDSAKYDSIYGALYNGYAVSDPRGFAPKGWRLPTEQEETSMSLYLGKNPIAGGKLKETGTVHWKSPNTGATNSTGFTALPAGDRGDGRQGEEGIFSDLGVYAIWWTQGGPNSMERWSFYAEYNSTWLMGLASTYKVEGFSVRLIKDSK